MYIMFFSYFVACKYEYKYVYKYVYKYLYKYDTLANKTEHKFGILKYSKYS